tara:strand:+ start:68 stop:388 length:321 start_codon:yes stop_codon:yes gene_type:complete
MSHELMTSMVQNRRVQVGTKLLRMMASANPRRIVFLKPEVDRENLTVLTGYLACRLRIEDRRAVAVEARDINGKEVVIRAQREMILTAGSFHSPKLLILSVIGPRD